MTATQAMRRERVSQALRAIEEGTRLDDLTDDEIDTIIDAARDHRQSIPVAAGVGEGLREALAVGERFLNACNSAWACGEPLHRVEKMMDCADEFRAALDALLARDALLLGGDAMRCSQPAISEPIADSRERPAASLRGEGQAAHPSTQEGDR